MAFNIMSVCAQHGEVIGLAVVSCAAEISLWREMNRNNMRRREYWDRTEQKSILMRKQFLEEWDRAEQKSILMRKQFLEEWKRRD